MRIESPEWLFLIPVLALLGWYLPHLRIWRPLRLACLACVVLALADPQRQTLRPGVDLQVLVDRSDSAEALVGPRVPEWMSILEDSMGANDTMRVIDFAESALERGAGDAAFESDGAATRTDVALRYALSRHDEGRASRVLVLTDGFSTAPIEWLAEPLNRSKIQAHYRLVSADAYDDVRVTRFELPETTQPGAPFLVEFEVLGSGDAAVDYRIFRDGEPIGEGRAELDGGRARVRLSDRLTRPGAAKYTVRVIGTEDERPGNNVAERWISVDSGPRVLLVSAYVDDPSAPVLRAQGFRVDLVTDYDSLNAGSLAGAKSVLINNVPANELPAEFLKEVASFVTVQGGGFAMFGGKYAFGSGGFYQSPVDDVLPVSMELREDQMRLATAMAIVMDRSGSMAATVGGNRTKMDMANAGAAGTVELLGPTDSLTVFAVDSLAHEVVPMTVVGGRKELLRNQILHVESMGGGIFVYTGLKAAWEQLKLVRVGQKHIILFSDAADSEEPGNYRSLIKEIRDAGGTVSVIGLGTEADADAEFLRDIAKRGGGRMFFNSNPMDLPRVFAQETVAVARSSFIEEPTGLVPQDGWLGIAARPLAWLPRVGGYNLSYLKEGATAAATSADEYRAPLVAFKRFGAGRSAALTFPVAGEFSEPARNWEAMPDMVQTLGRWLAGDPAPEGIGLRVEADGSTLTTDLLHDARHDLLVAYRPPTLRIIDDESDEARLLTWRRIRPGHFSATFDMEFGKVYKGAVQIGDHTLAFGPAMASESMEWQTDPSRIRELAGLAKATGGGRMDNLEDAWKGAETARYASLRIWLLLLLLPFCLGEFLLSRLKG